MIEGFPTPQVFLGWQPSWLRPLCFRISEENR